MRIPLLALAGGLALAALTAPAAAQHGMVTTVTPVHGPLKVLPHHRRKICTTRWHHHRRITSCHYR